MCSPWTFNWLGRPGGAKLLNVAVLYRCRSQARCGLLEGVLAAFAGWRGVSFEVGVAAHVFVHQMWVFPACFLCLKTGVCWEAAAAKGSAAFCCCRLSAGCEREAACLLGCAHCSGAWVLWFACAASPLSAAGALVWRSVLTTCDSACLALCAQHLCLLTAVLRSCSCTQLLPETASVSGRGRCVFVIACMHITAALLYC